MCQAALADLKMAIRAAGEHKQRIAVQVSIDGLRLRDEKSGDCLYHHPVHKISFIAQDMSDSRAFGYIFGSPDTGHRFFGIKTDKAASQVVIAMRDLFQVVFELKKKEIELTKQHLEQNAINVIKFHTTGIFVEPTPDTKGAAGSESSLLRVRNANSEADKSTDKRNEPQSGVIRDLLDIQFELDSLQQGIHHMDKITPENPPPSADDLFETDPFGDSFANMKLEDTVRAILPPPPSSSKRGHLERQQTVPGTQSSITSSPATTLTSKTPPLQSTIQWFDEETENLFSDSELTSSAKNTPVKKEVEETQAKSPQIDVFTELDPLGTGLIKPYVDKKDFFQHLKNPPKKVLKDLVSTNSADTFPTNFNVLSEPIESVKPRNDIVPKENQFEDTNFANFDRFDENEAIQSVFTRSDSSRKSDMTPRTTHHQPLSVSLPPEDSSTSKSSAISTIPTSVGVSLLGRIDKDSTESAHGLVKLPSPIKTTRQKEFDIDITGSKVPSMDKPFPVDFSTVSDSPASPLKSCPSDANSRLSTSSAELELVPEPPPRGIANILINPPPLPPKKQGVRGVVKPPPRPPHTDTYFHYDFPEREPVATSDKNMSPSRDAKSQSDDNFSPPVQLSSKSDLISVMTTSAFEDSFSSMVPTTNLSSFFTSTSSSTTGPKKTKPSLDITLSQLTSANLDELASSLGMTVKELTSLTLQQLTECLATLSAKEAAASDSEEPVPIKQEQVSAVQAQPVSSMVQPKPFNESQLFTKTNIDQETKQDATYDKYAVFRELLELEQMEKNEENVMKEFAEEEEVTKEEFELVSQHQETSEEIRSETLATLVNLTVKLPPSNEDLTKEEQIEAKSEDTTELSSRLTFEKIQSIELESKTEPVTEPEVPTDLLTKQEEEESDKTKAIIDIEERTEEPEPIDKPSESNEDSDKPETKETTTEEGNGPLVEVNKVEVKSSVSISSDKYAALREIIGEPEPPVKQLDEDIPNSTRMSPVIQLSTQQKTSAEVELLNLFSDTPPPSSPKKQSKNEEDSSSMGMDIFEEIKMLSSSGHAPKTKSLIPEDILCPFTELKPERDESKDDSSWTKFNTGLFVSDRPPSDCPPSISRTSPWSPDGKEFQREASFKGSMYQQSGDSDNEWKDEEESEESNGRVRDGRFRCSHYPRFDAPFGDRSFYEETSGPGGKRDRGFRDKMMEKPRDSAWIKNSGHRPRDSSPWHDESQWEKEPKHYPHRKMQYKDEEEHYEGHWKCRSKPQRWNWPHEHGPFYDEERKRKMMLWKEDRFGSQESMGYDDDDRWSRRKYERRRWDEDARFWSRRSTGPPDSDYPSRESYYYYRESRERPHDYPSAWNEDYGSDRPGDDSPRYNQSGRKRHWPKRPNSANEGRNTDMVYPESRGKFGTSRSECNDNDSDPYVRSSQRSRSRQSYWGSDQEYDSWADRPYWSEELDTKSESLHRKRIPRHKPRQPHTKTQSPFEDDFAQTVEHVDPTTVESLATAEPRIRSEGSERKPSPQSPSFTTRYPKAPRRAMGMDEVYSKRSSYFEDDLPFAATGMGDSPDRQRLPSDQKATPEELPCESKDAHQTTDDFVSGDGSRDSFFNGHLRYDDDAFAFKSEMEDNVSEHRATTLPLKNHGRQGKYSAGSNNNNNNNKSRNDQHIRKSESVNIFVRENDPFGDDDFFD
ncbi:protein disabled isoform X2 [Bombus vosnesenskii]|nr:protein disabled isoform X2 [Bombus vosnesenskii]